jgi:CHASE1-domain containing sensor protein
MPDLSEYTRKWRPVRHLWPIVAAACLGLAVAVAAWFAVSVWEDRLARTKFNNVAGDYASVLQNGLDDYLSKIVAVRAFYDSSHAVDPNEFALFTGRILEGHEDIMRITWSPRVAGDERAEFQLKARDEGIEGYEIKAWAPGGTLGSAPQENEYFPVLYSTGIPTALSVLCVDLRRKFAS